MKTVQLMNYKIGEGRPPFIVAELGICHEGDVNLAIELAKESINAGANCIKTETFNHEAMVFDPSAVTSYTINGKKHTVSLIEHMKQFELPLEDHHKVKKLCDTYEIPFISTAHDFKSIDFLYDIGAAAIKIASPDIVHYPLLKHAARRRLPVILDSGKAYQYEIEIAVKVLRENGLEDIVVNHNPEGHPAPADRHDLAIIPRLKEITGLPVGIADHYEGYEMMYAAAAVGADLIEKPVSKDRFDPLPEKNWSISAPDLKDVFEKTNKIFKALGKKERVMSKEAEKSREQNRMACAAAESLQKGEKICFENIIFGRPRKGIGVEYWDIIEGRTLRNPKNQYEFIQWNDLD